MRYTVDPVEVSRALEHVTRGLRTTGAGASGALEGVGRGVPGGVTASRLADLLVRWRTRERRVEQGLTTHAEHLAEAARRYVYVEDAGAARLGDGA